MSSGAVFKLISNDGKADRMIMATELTRLLKVCVHNVCIILISQVVQSKPIVQ
jgi:hypothetical protein